MTALGVRPGGHDALRRVRILPSNTALDPSLKAPLSQPPGSGTTLVSLRAAGRAQRSSCPTPQIKNHRLAFAGPSSLYHAVQQRYLRPCAVTVSVRRRCPSHEPKQWVEGDDTGVLQAGAAVSRLTTTLSRPRSDARRVLFSPPRKTPIGQERSGRVALGESARGSQPASQQGAAVNDAGAPIGLLPSLESSSGVLIP